MATYYWHMSPCKLATEKTQISKFRCFCAGASCRCPCLNPPLVQQITLLLLSFKVPSLSHLYHHCGTTVAFTLPLNLYYKSAQLYVKDSIKLFCSLPPLFLWFSECVFWNAALFCAAVRVRARERTMRPVVLHSLSGVLGACTLMGVNMLAARPPANSDCRENTPRRWVTVSELESFPLHYIRLWVLLLWSCDDAHKGLKWITSCRACISMQIDCKHKQLPLHSQPEMHFVFCILLNNKQYWNVCHIMNILLI